MGPEARVERFLMCKNVMLSPNPRRGDVGVMYRGGWGVEDKKKEKQEEGDREEGGMYVLGRYSSTPSGLTACTRS